MRIFNTLCLETRLAFSFFTDGSAVVCACTGVPGAPGVPGLALLDGFRDDLLPMTVYHVDSNFKNHNSIESKIAMQSRFSHLSQRLIN
jgi:hypothetical protein